MTHEQFEDLFSVWITAFQSYLEEDIYLNVVFTNFHSKEERISLQTKLYQYVLQNNEDLYKNTNDASVERMIETDPEDELVQILRKKYDTDEDDYVTDEDEILVKYESEVESEEEKCALSTQCALLGCKIMMVDKCWRYLWK